MVAHAIDNAAAFFRRGVDHISSGTHTERVDAPAIGRRMGQFIGCAPKDAVGCHSILGQINHLLGVFDPQTDGKGFGCHLHAVFFKHPKCIPGAVSHCRNKTFTVYPPAVVHANLF